MSQSSEERLIELYGLIEELSKNAYINGLNGKKPTGTMMGMIQGKDMNRTSLIALASLIDVLVAKKYCQGASVRHNLLGNEREVKK